MHTSYVTITRGNLKTSQMSHVLNLYGFNFQRLRFRDFAACPLTNGSIKFTLWLPSLGSFLMPQWCNYMKMAKHLPGHGPEPSPCCRTKGLFLKKDRLCAFRYHSLSQSCGFRFFDLVKCYPRHLSSGKWFKKSALIALWFYFTKFLLTDLSSISFF